MHSDRNNITHSFVLYCLPSFGSIVNLKNIFEDISCCYYYFRQCQCITSNIDLSIFLTVICPAQCQAVDSRKLLTFGSLPLTLVGPQTETYIYIYAYIESCTHQSNECNVAEHFGFWLVGIVDGVYFGQRTAMRLHGACNMPAGPAEKQCGNVNFDALQAY